MPSFTALCPRGHMGNFVTVGNYHICFCQLQIPIFNPPPPPFYTIDVVEYSITLEEQTRLNDQYIKQEVDEQVAAKVEDAITNVQSELEDSLLIQLAEQAERLTQVDPEFHG